jgi:hypothetical protein
VKFEDILPEIRKGRKARRKDFAMVDLEPGDKHLDLDVDDLLADDWELVPEPKKFKRLAYLWSDGVLTTEPHRVSASHVSFVGHREIEWEVPE